MVTGEVVTQTVFGAAVGVSQQAISELVNKGVLTEGQGADVWLLAYCHRLREQAAGRLGSEIGGLDLAQERAALAREQRLGIEIKNAVLRGEYAAIELLGEVLARASQAVAERFDHLPGRLKKACPDLPGQALEQVLQVIATARNEWVRETSTLVSAQVAGEDDDELLDVSDEPRAD
jgi:phage terminase Nu1 subunit (DNA packaging protein)